MFSVPQREGNHEAPTGRVKLRERSKRPDSLGFS
jgi:hypothetical protein